MFMSFVNAQTIPKSIDKPITPTKTSTKNKLVQKKSKNWKLRYSYIDTESYEGFIRVQRYVKDANGDYNRTVMGFVNLQGEEVIPCIYDGGVCDFKDGIAAVSLEINDIRKQGFINRQGKVIIPIIYENSDAACLDFDDSCLNLDGRSTVWVILNDKCGFIDKTGKEVITIKYDNLFCFEEGLAGAKLDGKYGFINKSEEIIIPFKYENASDFSEGLAAVQLNGKYGCINKSGVVAIPFKYDYIFDFSNGMASVKLNGKCGFINAVGEVVISIKYDQIFYYEDEKIFRAKLNGKSMILDKNGNCVKDCD